MTRNNKKYSGTAVEESLAYFFVNRSLIEEALTHKSYYHEHSDKTPWYNERLEFLGDSVLGLVIVEYLFLHEKSYTEAVLAKIKSFIVSEPVLAEIASGLSLGDYLLMGKGERATGGAGKKSILANTFEAVIGAVYLDGGFDKVRDIILRFFSGRINKAIESGDFFDYKTELQEKSQSIYGRLPEYRVVRQEGEEHERIFTVSVFLNGNKLGTASGRRKKEAETFAAKEALSKLSESAKVDELDMDAEVLSPEQAD